MNRNQLNLSRVAMIGIALALVGYEAAAVDELVVYGSRDAEVTAVDADLERRMSAYVEGLNAAQKARLDAALKTARTKQIQIAAAKVPTRG